jgi:hypothetical protein
MAPAMASNESSPPDDERVPLFGTWPRIYAAVVLSALLVMALVAVFSVFPY